MTDWTEWQKLEISRLREMQHDPARRFAFGTLVIEHADELLTAAEALARIRAIARDETDLGSFSQRVGEVLDELDARQATSQPATLSATTSRSACRSAASPA